MGDDYVVLDLLEAPTTADVLLVHPVSPQLLGNLRGMFPQARVIVTEIEDPELGITGTGPAARAMGAGAEAYRTPRPIARLGQDLGAALAAGGFDELASRRRVTPEITGHQYRA